MIMAKTFEKKEKKGNNSQLKATQSKKLGIVKCKITDNKTNSTSYKNVKKKWILIDAENAVVGRLAAYLVHRLNGKHLATYTPNTDDGDKIVVVNCDKIRFTGSKELQKKYRDHSDYVGNVRVRTAKEVREGKKPCDLLRIAVSRMLGRCKMSYKLVSKNLYLYAGNEHQQTAQSPLVIKFNELNRKNVI